MKKTVFILAIIIMITGVTVQVNAQRGNDPDMRGPHGRMGTRLSPNMGACNPALIEKRKEFDSELNSEEKAIIMEYRAKLPEIREQMREKIQKQRAECDGKPIGRMRSEMQNEFAPIVNIAEKHNERLAVIAKDHFVNRNQAGMNGKRGRYSGQRGFGKGQCDGTGQGYGYGRAGQGYGRGNTNGKQGRGMNANERGYMFAIHFLLMDTEQSLTTGQTIERNFEVMPNPAKNSNTINYEVLSTGKVKIEILDKDGFIVRTVLDATKEKGVYTLNVNVSDLEQNLYFYRIMDNSGTDSIKFIIAK